MQMQCTSTILQGNQRSWVEIDLSRVKHNVNEMKTLLSPQTKIMAIVKANAYGHGDVVIAQELQKQGIDFFGVASVDEAITLRNNGIQEKILILGYTPPIYFPYLLQYQLIQTVYSSAYAQKLQDFAKQQQIALIVHIKVDTGMARLGFQCKENIWEIEAIKKIYQHSYLVVDGIFSHFSVSDSLIKEEDVAYTKQQIAYYNQVLEELKASGINPGLTHLQNSYGILNYPELSYDYVRPGLLHLGVTSSSEIETKSNLNLLPILQWKANVSLVKEINANSYVSYGRNYKANKMRKIATISCGYADGYPRALSNIGKEVLLHGQKAEIIGNICMDQMMIDVTHIQNVQEGDEVILIGEDQGVSMPVDDISKKSQTINNDILCRIGVRVPRIYTHTSSE